MKVLIMFKFILILLFCVHSHFVQARVLINQGNYPDRSLMVNKTLDRTIREQDKDMENKLKALDVKLENRIKQALDNPLANK